MVEIENMHGIYQSADLTIVAATGNDAGAGLIHMDATVDDDESETIGGQRFTLDTPEMRDVTEFSTWFTRGWTLQELLFSYRLLFMTPNRTYFNCQVGNWSEDFPLDSSIDPKYYHNLVLVAGLKEGFNFSDSVSAFENYSSLVEKMSIRQLAQDSDILKACRGFYRGILIHSMGESISGLPTACFDYALAWHPDGALRRRGPSDTGLPFPTWSWAGFAGPIH